MSAQNSSLIIGVNGGANLSKLTPTGAYEFAESTNSRKLRFQGGLDLGFKYNSFSFLTGLKYNQRGGKSEIKNDNVNNPFVFTDGSTDTGIFTSTNTFTQLSIPLLLRYETTGDLAFSITLGPSINMGIGDINFLEELDLDNLPDPQSETSTETYGSQPNNLYKKVKTGFVFSPGILYKVGDSGRLRVNFIYENVGDIINPTHGLTDNQGNTLDLIGTAKSSSIAFEIGYEHRIDFTMGAKY